MGQIDGVANFRLMREIELRMLIGLLIVETAGLPSLLAHDLDHVLNLGGDHGKVGRRNRLIPITKRLEIDRCGDVQIWTDLDATQDDGIPAKRMD